MIKRPETELPAPYGTMLSAYAAALAGSTLADSSKARYVARVRRFLTWAAGTVTAGSLDGAPLADMTVACKAAREYYRHLKEGAYAPATIDNILAAVDDFYARSGLGATGIRREGTRPRSRPAVHDRGSSRRAQPGKPRSGHSETRAPC